LEPALRFVNVSKDYLADGARVSALNGVNLEIGPGQFAALVGRSGCGKSTLLNLAGAMDFPTHGEVFIGGEPTSALDDARLTALRRRRIGFIFQSFQLLGTLSVAENVETPLLLAGERNARARALAALRWVDLENLAGRMPHQLSGGQMQRVAIARALVHEPSLILADEPTGNLDSATGNLVIGVLRRVAAERGVTVVMATHSAESAAAADLTVRLRDGRVEETAAR